MCAKSVHLHENCSCCSGRVFRQLIREETPPDDNGNTFYRTRVQDVCTSCNVIIRQSTVAPAPCQALDQVFISWERSLINREAFDEHIAYAFSSYGISFRWIA